MFPAVTARAAATGGLLLLVLSAARPATAEEAAEAAYRRHLTAARGALQAGNARRASGGFLAALQARPDGAEAWVGLAESTADAARRALLLREALRRAPEHPAVKAALARLTAAPQVKTVGVAVKLEAAYFGRSANDGSLDGTASADAGRPLDVRLVVVHGLDGAGDLVPVDPALSGEEGLEADPKEPGRVLARQAARRANLKVRDRKSGLEATVPVRIVGLAAEVKITSRDTRVGEGEMLHLGARASDAAGNRLWVAKLVWKARGGEADRPETLDVPASLMPEGVYEAHRNIVHGRAGGYQGPLVVTATEPASGKQDSVTLTIVKEKTGPEREVGKLVWIEGLDRAVAEAKKTGKPLLVYFYADW